MSVVRNRGLVMSIFVLTLCASVTAQQKMLWQGVVEPVRCDPEYSKACKFMVYTGHNEAVEIGNAKD